MKKLLIITNEKKDPNRQVTQKIEDYLEGKALTRVLKKKDAQGYLLDESDRDACCVLVLGGDGTLIQAARELGRYDIPLLGINLGTLGYLSEVERKHEKEALEQVLSGEYSIEERMMLQGTLPDGKSVLALNDVTVTRVKSLHIIEFNLIVNGELLNSFQADGVIVSTPTGSTGYNLSAGGPIVEPTAAMIVVTPICSHELGAASIVLSAEDEVVIEIGGGHDQEQETAAAFDGGELVSLKDGQRLSICRARKTTRLLRLNRQNFLDTLARKMKGK